MSASPPRRESSLRRAMAPGQHGYGLLLALILTSLTFQLASTEGDVTHVVTILLQGGTVLAALWTSLPRSRPLVLASIALTVVTVVSAIAFAASGEVDAAGARIVSLVLVLLAPATIVHGVVRHFREEGQVTVQTMFGVLCVYLLIGASFAFAYGVIDNLNAAAPFFASGVEGTTSDYLYFSFATITTVGYGDLTAASDLGRSLAITEALLGQIYMVTVVALIVGNLRRPA